MKTSPGDTIRHHPDPRYVGLVERRGAVHELVVCDMALPSEALDPAVPFSAEGRMLTLFLCNPEAYGKCDGEGWFSPLGRDTGPVYSEYICARVDIVLNTGCYWYPMLRHSVGHTPVISRKVAQKSNSMLVNVLRDFRWDWGRKYWADMGNARDCYPIYLGMTFDQVLKQVAEVAVDVHYREKIKGDNGWVMPPLTQYTRISANGVPLFPAANNPPVGK